MSNRSRLADTTTGQAALRWGSWKLLLNESTFVGWFDGSGSDWGIEYCSNTATNTVSERVKERVKECECELETE